MTITKIEPINKPGISVYVDFVREVIIHHRVTFSDGQSRLFMTYVNEKVSSLEAGDHPSVRFFSLTKCGSFQQIFPACRRRS